MSAFKCKVCDMDLNSQEQLEQHRTGRKHLNKMKDMRVGLSIAKYDNSVAKAKLYGTFVSSSEKKKGRPGNAPPSHNLNEYSSLPPTRPPPRMFLQGGGMSLGRGPIINRGPPMFTPQQPELPLLPGMNPVMNAVVNNALGNLPLKRKLYTGRCDACQLEFNAESQERQHFAGKKHAKRMRVMGLEEKEDQLMSPVPKANGFSCQFCDTVLNSLEQLEQHRLGSKHKKKVEAATGKPPMDVEDSDSDTSDTAQGDSDPDD